ncbi:hypothetical protein WJX74_005888 [Apatococcus lobatus]|uniref:Uncharacterized protein n=1 Tax=Apatococcus lobatus TaxID=904363 RepID=A0AAW1RAZ9_9CHLO
MEKSSISTKLPNDLLRRTLGSATSVPEVPGTPGEAEPDATFTTFESADVSGVSRPGKSKARPPALTCQACKLTGGQQMHVCGPLLIAMNDRSFQLLAS